MKRILALGSAAIVLMISVTAGAAQITPTLVLGGNKIDQIEPAANATYLAWNQNSTSHPKHYDALYQTLPVGSASPVRMNAPGTSGFTPAIDGDTTNAAFQESGTVDSNIVLYNLATHLTAAPPSGINTSYWEWEPSISQGFIEFGRNSFVKPSSPWKVMVYNPNTSHVITLATEPFSCQCTFPGQVSSQYATWTVCPKSCSAYYYVFADHSTHKIPNPRGDAQYYPSVDPVTGAFFYVRSGQTCGSHVKIMRWSIGDPSPTVVASLPPGYDVDWKTFDYRDGSSNDNVYFDRLKCSGNYYSDIYEVAAANTASPTLTQVGTGSTLTRVPGAKAAPSGGVSWPSAGPGAKP